MSAHALTLSLTHSLTHSLTYSCRKQFASRPEDRGLRNILETLKQLFVWLTGFKMFTKTCWLCWPLSGALRTNWPDSNWNYGLSTLPINLSNLHGNAEQPACYSSLLVVCDSTLTPSQRCDVPAPSKRPQQQHRFTSETSQE